MKPPIIRFRYTELPLPITLQLRGGISVAWGVSTVGIDSEMNDAERAAWAMADDIETLDETMTRVRAQLQALSARRVVTPFPGGLQSAAIRPDAGWLTNPVVMVVNWSLTLYALLFPSLTTLARALF